MNAKLGRRSRADESPIRRPQMNAKLGRRSRADETPMFVAADE
jgi:hypothetical protein